MNDGIRDPLQPVGAGPNASGVTSGRLIEEMRRYVIVEPRPFVVDLARSSGICLATVEFFRKLSAVCHEHDVKLAFDEVQTAGGQTGTFFAIDAFDLPHPPQAVASGKKLGNGVVYMLHPMKDQGILDSTWGGTLADLVRFVQEMRIVRDGRTLERLLTRIQGEREAAVA